MNDLIFGCFFAVIGLIAALWSIVAFDHSPNRLDRFMSVLAFGVGIATMLAGVHIGVGR